MAHRRLQRDGMRRGVEDRAPAQRAALPLPDAVGKLVLACLLQLPRHRLTLITFDPRHAGPWACIASGARRWFLGCASHATDWKHAAASPRQRSLLVRRMGVSVEDTKKLIGSRQSDLLDGRMDVTAEDGAGWSVAFCLRIARIRKRPNSSPKLPCRVSPKTKCGEGKARSWRSCRRRPLLYRYPPALAHGGDGSCAPVRPNHKHHEGTPRLLRRLPDVPDEPVLATAHDPIL